MTATAERVYVDLYRKCKTAENLGHPESIHCKVFRIVEEAVKKIIPHDPLNKTHALPGESLKHLSSPQKKNEDNVDRLICEASRLYPIYF
jgi:hypothetical protein